MSKLEGWGYPMAGPQNWRDYVMLDDEVIKNSRKH
jgi:hypothetical protein